MLYIIIAKWPEQEAATALCQHTKLRVNSLYLRMYVLEMLSIMLKCMLFVLLDESGNEVADIFYVLDENFAWVN